MKRLLLLGVLLGVPLQAATAAHWFDMLPADDPDVVVRRTVPPVPQAPAPQSTGLPVMIVQQTFGAVTGIIGTVFGGIGSIASGTREAAWETAYMFGFNSTKVSRAEIADTTPDLKLPSEDTTPVHVMRAEPVTQVASADPVVPVAPTSREPTPVLTPPVAAADTPAAPQDIDPGLLANFVFDRGSRRPDGSFLVPKPLQRLFEVRTSKVEAAEVPVSVTLAGRIVPDRHTEANVEASVIGRIEAPPSGLPVLGDQVHKGQVIAYVVPAVGVVDRTQVRREVARLTTEIRVETENLEILKQFTFVPFRDGKIYQSEQRLAGLRREREALLPMLQTQEVLRAQSDGVISMSTAILGRVVQPGEVIFQIVDPKALWVEALAPDPKIAESAQRVAKASALTPEGQMLRLTYIGSGLALQQQSAPILFRIENAPEGLRVGRPVTVAVQSEDHSQLGLPVTRDALTIGPDGVREVWEQTEPETFLPRTVTTHDIDGRTVLVVDGLKEGAHVVVNGVRLLAQLQ